MKLLSSHFVVPAFLAALSSLAGCSSDNPAAGNTAGSSPGGSTGKAGSAGSGVGGASTAGTGAGGANTAGASVGGAGASAGSAGSGTAGAGTAGTGTAGSGTAGSGTAGGAAVEASFAMVKDVINSTCFGNGCHSQEGNPLQMKIDDKLYATLTTHVTMNCGKLINTASPADSAIVKLLKADCGTAAPKITPRMPWDKCFQDDPSSEEFCVPPAKIAAIQAWIAKGAPMQ